MYHTVLAFNSFPMFSQIFPHIILSYAMIAGGAKKKNNCNILFYALKIV